MLSPWALSHAHYQIFRYGFLSNCVTFKSLLLPSPRDEVMRRLLCFQHSVLLFKCILRNEHRNGERLVCSATEEEPCSLHLLGVQVYLCMPLG